MIFNRVVQPRIVMAFLLCFLASLRSEGLLEQLQRETNALVDNARSSIVTVTVPFDTEGMAVRSVLVTSGLVVGDSLVVTAYNVVATSTTVEVSPIGGEPVIADVAGMDSLSGVALLKLKAPIHGVVPAPIGALPTVGDWAFLVTTPFEELAGYSPGIIRAVRPAGMNGQVTTEIESTSTALPASAGAALVDIRGRIMGLVVGRTVQNFQSEGESSHLSPGVFAVPLDEVMAMTSELATHGRVTRSWLGVSVQQMTPALRSILGVDPDQGAIIIDVEEGGPAYLAGLEMGDVILACAGVPVTSPGDLMSSVARISPGSDLVFDVLRNDEITAFPVTMAELPERAGSARTRNPFQD